jgi:hypothetical protein
MNTPQTPQSSAGMRPTAIRQQPSAGSQLGWHNAHQHHQDAVNAKLQGCCFIQATAAYHNQTRKLNHDDSTPNYLLKCRGQ